ncbi:Major facilitator superfamily domain general substrate transporter [Penicillium cf. griseofulvum]|uniref:Major facilitator superfamily domain general substrate transporter n=1 Tax=Penicillium cf. griseofulvum TaxID=2972120 RepID=A0A9W9IUU2_9EURO|nr:Major facilitator superfamily domain general substrate transporter [Penicillium cf. griseofulvum]KAJ5429644.1 Major facilitator superfamily domain general substrate transporter [Penicillium cf. griseofulvum]
MESVIREAPFGQLVRFLTNNTYFQYPEEKPGFKLPDTWLKSLNPSGDESDEKDIIRQDSNQSHDNSDTLTRASTQASMQFTEARLEADEQHEIEKLKSIPIAPKKIKDGSILVDWYYTDDPENPHNWSNRKRALITTMICLYTFVVYTTSAIYTSSTEGIMKEFGVSSLVSTLGLSLYVLGYGIGPLVFSPLSEIPTIGRNPVYIITMFLFVIISIPTAFVDNFPGLMVLRFLQGFFGSPCLASGGASIGDMYSLMSLPYAMMAWVSAAYCGPALGPLLSGFAVPVKGWRWSLFESIWASAPVFILMFMFLPETSSATILLRRANRLRKIHSNNNFQSQSEIDQRNMQISAVAIDALIKPLEITIKDPAVLFVQIYTAIIYGIYYSFFEVFPLVYPVDYNMNLGQTGLVFLCVLVACIIGVAMYAGYIYFWMNPRIRRFGFPQNEKLLIPALPASFGPLIGLFIFAWTARASIHWIVPTIGITIYGATVFIVMQCIFIYVPLTYPKYAASLFAANDFFRSALACGSVLFAHPLFGNLGVARGVSLLGGLSVIGIIGIWLLYFYGGRLRALSKFAT